jgi:hypothetical protein
LLGPPIDSCVAVLAYDLDNVTAVKKLVAAAPTLLLVVRLHIGPCATLASAVLSSVSVLWI